MPLRAPGRLALALMLLLVPRLRAEEGMWPFDRIPADRIAARYGMVLDQAWLDHLRLSTVVFGNSGTGCFVGRSGLVLTNQHVAHASLLQLSRPGHDLVRSGFLARGQDQELPVPGLAFRVLVAMRDVPARVGLDPAQARQAAEEALRAAERTEAASLSWELVDVDGGAEYRLYGYRTFQDVRLVMAPEFDIAAFGKDWDNFAYPRHDLDVALFRVYEDGQPFRPEHALAWSQKGIAAGEPTFVAGHPGRTNRQEPWARTDYRRRVENPLIVATLERTLATLKAFAARGEREA
ncbi:MAG TPA: S46 family peptidase, partial [Holophaga sp.]|nr:S46 family peptidase [Holophaga sp.]